MPFAGIDTDTIRDSAFSLRRARDTLSTVLGDLDSAATMAALQSEISPVRSLAVELDDEIDLLQRVLVLKADAMELADSGYSTGGVHLLGEVQRLSSQLHVSLGDAIGFSGTGSDVRAYYEAKALAAAGIVLADWDPALGVDHNAAIIEAVYTYYSDLHLANPDLLWPGIGALAGATFAGGFNDLDTFADLFSTSDRPGYTFHDFVEAIGRLPIIISIPEIESLEATAALEQGAIEAELRWYESAFLTMQRRIFLDMGSSHEAYLDGGMLAIEKLYENDPYGQSGQAIDSWRKIDEGVHTGNRALLEEGTVGLAYREQKYIIGRDYEFMFDRRITGPAVTYLATLVGNPSVPGSRSFPQMFPIEATVGGRGGTPSRFDIPFTDRHIPLPNASVGGSVTVSTPFPNGNIAHFDDRWEMFSEDTLPVFFDLAAQPGGLETLLAVPIAERAEAYQFPNQLDEIVSWMVRDGWEVDADVDLSVGFGD